MASASLNTFKDYKITNACNVPLTCFPMLINPVLLYSPSQSPFLGRSTQGGPYGPTYLAMSNIQAAVIRPLQFENLPKDLSFDKLVFTFMFTSLPMLIDPVIVLEIAFQEN